MTVTDHHVMCIPPTVTRYHVKRFPFEDGWLFVGESIVWCLVAFIELFICVNHMLFATIYSQCTHDTCHWCVHL